MAEFNVAIQSDGRMKLAVWGHRASPSNRKYVDIYKDGRWWTGFYLDSDKTSYIIKNVVELEADWYDIEVDVDDRPIRHQSGRWYQSVYMGGPGDRATFDVAYYDDTEELKIHVWGCELGGERFTARAYDEDSRRIGSFLVSGSGGTGYFDVSHYSSGWHYVEVDIESTTIDAQEGGKSASFYIPPRVIPVSRITPTKIDWGYYGPTITFTANGDGFIDLYSRSQRKYIKTSLYVDEGRNELSLSSRDIGEMDGHTDVPAGTCWFEKNNTNITYGPREFYLLRQYRFTVYNGEYDANITLGNTQTVAFSDLTLQWKRLLNGFYYISSAIDGRFGDVQYGNSYPKTGREITASMYNDLIDSGDELARKMGRSRLTPSKVRRGEVIDRYFISDLGRIYNEGVEYLMTEKSDLG